MKFVTVREFRALGAAVRKDLEREGYLVLTSNGRPFAVLSSVTPDSLEKELMALRRARAKAALDRIRADARKDGRDALSPADVNGIVAESRTGKRKRRRQ